MKINGISLSGNSVSIKNGNIMVDGVPVDVGPINGTRLSIDVTGDLVSLTADGDVSCNNISGNTSAGGDIRCREIGSNASAGGDIHVGTIHGNASAGGDVKAHTISGKITAGGDVIGGRK